MLKIECPSDGSYEYLRPRLARNIILYLVAKRFGQSAGG